MADVVKLPLMVERVKCSVRIVPSTEFLILWHKDIIYVFIVVNDDSMK